MFEKLRKLWNDRGFEILVMMCVIGILVIGIYNVFSKKSGSWSSNFRIPFFSRRYSRNTLDSPSVVTQSKKTFDSKGELECRRVLSEYFGKPFNKQRPDFLRNTVLNNGQNLELDCFDTVLVHGKYSVPIGVEYHGRQHYEYVPHFHRNRDAFQNQKYRDDIKRRLCKENGVVLIEVPYTVKLADIEQYLYNELAKRKLI